LKAGTPFEIASTPVIAVQRWRTPSAGEVPSVAEPAEGGSGASTGTNVPVKYW